MISRICKLLGFQQACFSGPGLMWAQGTTVPADTTAGYEKGCIFIDTDASAGDVAWINVGSVTSCDFDTIEA